MDKNKLIVILTLGFTGLIIIIGALWFFSQEKKDDTVTSIDNYTQNVSNLPNEARTSIERSLFGIIKINNEGIDPSNVEGAVIREGSNEQEGNANKQYQGTFIVDIPSIRQSYRLTYKYSGIDSGFDTAYPYLASCLKDEEYIYEKFDCKNQQYAEAAGDPLLQKLPHEASNYKIIARGETGIIIQVTLNHTSRTDKFFKVYREEAKRWLTNEGFNLDNYQLEYRDIQNNIVNLN